MKIRHITSGLQFPEGPIAMDDGSVLLVEIARGTLSRVTPDGRIHVVSQTGRRAQRRGHRAGRRGLRLQQRRLRIHHRGRRLLPPDRAGARLCRRAASSASTWPPARFERLFDTVDGLGLRGPNDIVFDAHGGFYFTDLGKARAHDMDHGGVYYAPAGGAAPRTIARPALTPNGVAPVARRPARCTTPRPPARGCGPSTSRRPARCARTPWPSPHGGRMVAASPGGHFQRFDSMAVDAHGNLHVATLMHGGISVVSPDGRTVHHVPLPDRFVTNLCFGGRDLRTAVRHAVGQRPADRHRRLADGRAAAELQRLIRPPARTLLLCAAPNGHATGSARSH